MAEELQIPQSDATILGNLIRHEYQQLDSQGVEAIAPEQLAATVYGQIDPELQSPGLVQCAAVLELRQIARGICRQRQVIAEHESEQRGLFDLQPRYPAEREGRDVYVLRECLTYQERKDNESRLRQEGQAKIRHADALAAETAALIQRGQLSLPLPNVSSYQAGISN